EVARDLLVVDLIVGHGGAELSIPVDQSLASIDLAGLEEVEERPADGPRADLVQGETVPLPVAGAAHQAELGQDPRFVFVLPGPDPLDQCLPAQVVAGGLLFLVQWPFRGAVGGGVAAGRVRGLASG